MYRPLLLLSSVVFVSLASAQTSPSFELGQNALNVSSGYIPPVTGDFNGDGKPDIVVPGTINVSGTPSSTSGFTLLLGKGDGTFQDPIAGGTSDSSVVDIAVADFNKDGKLDIVTIDTNNSINVFLGNGDGTFRAPIVVATAAQPEVGAVGNFFNDGYTDIAVADIAGNIELFRNQGGASFTMANSIPSVAPSSANSYASFRRLRAVDFNATGVSDLAFLLPTGAYALWNNGSGSFTQTLLSNYDSAQDLNVGYVNQSAMADVIVSYSCAQSDIEAGHNNPSICAGIDVFYGQGNNQVFKRTAVKQNGPSAAGFPMAADVNGDGIADLVASGSSPGGTQEGLYVWLGNADGSFSQTALIYNVGDNGPLVAGDWNRDGMIDFFQVLYGSDSSEAYINGGQRAACQTETISPTVTVCSPVNNTYVQPVVNVQATTYDKNQVTALQEYVDGQLQYSEAVTSLNYTSPALAPGSHMLFTKAWDSTGVQFSSPRTVFVYNGTPGPTCAAAAGTANLCLPGSGTLTSPVTVLGNGAPANANEIPTAAQLYVDGTLVVNNQGQCYSNGYCEGGTSYVQTTLGLSTGTHDLVFKLYDAYGNVYTAEKSVTVQ